MSSCPTEEELRWQQVQQALAEAYQRSTVKDCFLTLSKVQEAEIVLRAIQRQLECDKRFR